MAKRPASAGARAALDTPQGEQQVPPPPEVPTRPRKIRPPRSGHRLDGATLDLCLDDDRSLARSCALRLGLRSALRERWRGIGWGLAAGDCLQEVVSATIDAPGSAQRKVPSLPELSVRADWTRA